MRKQGSNVSKIDETRRCVKNRLQELYEKQSIKPLRDLFTTELNYNYSDIRLNLPDNNKEMVYENEYPRIIATGGNSDFKIIYIRLRKSLSRVYERTLITKLLLNNLYALFIFSDAEQREWHFVNVKYKEGGDDTKSRLLRRITIGQEEQLRTAIERIAMLDLSTLDGDISTLSALTIQKMFDHAFDVEEVTLAFFRDYRLSFDMLQKDLYKQTGNETWSHDYALQLLNRCMFLYFIQRKRWLGGDIEFLKTFWDEYNKGEHEPDTFVHAWLNTLFFKAFNNKYGVMYNYFPSHIHNILMLAPFLNGGLFTENELDQQKDFVVSDLRFSDIFTLLQRYNFTIAEDNPLDQEVAVDPEMIGTVYESLVNVSTERDERSGAGIFYTPRTEIDLMCRLTLVDYLTNHLGKERKHLLYNAVFAIEQEDKDTADQRLKDADLWREVYDLLNTITMIDPACGSGAFLVGMLAVLDDMIGRAIQASGLENAYDPYNAYERKKRIIGQSLYGVDVMEWAAHIAELRLWLALIVDAEYTPESLHVRTEPLLPYFTFKVRCGDSLVQEVGGIKLGLKQKKTLSSMLQRRVDKLRQQKLEFYNNKPSRELSEKEDVQRVERNLFKDILGEQIHAKEEEKKKLTLLIKEVRAKQLSLIDDTIAHASAEAFERQKQHAECEEDLAQLSKTLDVVSTSKTLPFVWDIAFGEIFVDGQCFDIVLGNPPYLRQENIHTPYLKDYSKEDNKAYKTKLAHAMYELFPHFFGYTDKYGKQTSGNPRNPINQKSDLYIYFYLLGLSLLNPKGTFCFITSNSWLDVGYGADLQKFLLKHCHIKLILDNETMRSFVSASVNTVIAHFSPPNEQSDWGLQEMARFVMSKVPFEDLLVAKIFEDIELAQSRQIHRSYRVFPIKQDALLEDGKIALVEDDDEEEEQIGKKGKKIPVRIVTEPSYTGNKWGGKYLRAPDIYWTIMERGKDKLVRLGDIAEVRRGVTTGANEFFYLDDAKIRQWKIESEFLVPIIKSPRECKSMLVDIRSLKSKLFLCSQSKEELKGTKALEYIKWGESKGFQKRPSCVGRARWWSLVLNTANSVFVKEGNETSAVFYNPESYPVDCRLYYANLSSTVMVYLNSVLGALSFEIYNRAGLGEGARSLMVADYEQIPVLVKEVVGVEVALQGMYVLAPRKLMGVQEQEWLEIDRIIFDELGLTGGECEGVYEAVGELMHVRLNKAKSLGVAKARKWGGRDVV